MDHPKNTAVRLAAEWMIHLSCEHAWDELNEIVASQPERAWSIIQTLIAVAPTYDLLATVGAGPIEDLLSQHEDPFMEIVAEEAKTNARLRVCLDTVYVEFPPELRALIKAETADVRDLAIGEKATASGDDLALIVAWLHHSDTGWSVEFLQDLTQNDPAGAWDVLRVLAMFADQDARLREDIFNEAFEPFLQRHFSAYRDKLVALGRKNAAFRQWCRDQRRPPIEDAALWEEFLAKIASA